MPRWLICLLLLTGLGARLAGAEWSPITWNREAAYASSSAGWRAVVSVVRGRLMHFGPAGSDLNLLLAPTGTINRNRLGGHRLWLGPQAEWPHGWPPPDAWEYRAPESVATEAGVLRLAMPPTGDAWPRLTRTYHWDGASLVCGAEFSGGTRPAQFVHILQVRPGMTVSAEARPEESFPAGYVLLPSTAGSFSARFTPPPHVTRTGDALTLGHTGVVAKLGFRPQTLAGRIDGHELRVSRGAQTGVIVRDPDEGFHTQVYLSEAGEAFAELEQLSPLFSPGPMARFEIVLTGQAL
jgi:hypothetical protein